MLCRDSIRVGERNRTSPCNSTDGTNTNKIDFDYILLWVGLETGDGDWVKTGAFSNWFSATTILGFGNKMCVLPLKFSFVSHRDPPERD